MTLMRDDPYEVDDKWVCIVWNGTRAYPCGGWTEEEATQTADFMILAIKANIHKSVRIFGSGENFFDGGPANPRGIYE